MNGGPPRHLDRDQEEWFYALEGEVLIEVGQGRTRLKPGDSARAPRKARHAWAYVVDNPGRLLIAFAPAGKMEAFFRKLTKPDHAPQDAALFRAPGMELVGRMLSLE